MLCKTLSLIALLSGLAAVPAQATPATPTQLPGGVEPVSYDLTVTPDAQKLTFAGHLAVTVISERGVGRIVLNSLNLEISAAAIDGAPAATALDPKAQTATFTPAK
ncbi:MAG: M1 family peptidase, partial [Phenylobacterium sp.]